MVAYSFQARFRDPILEGTKQQTIRAERKRHARPGEEMQLYTGMRTRQCKLIGRVTCASVAPISLDFDRGEILLGTVETRQPDSLDMFARCDGFQGWLDMEAFWFENHSGKRQFSGILIQWCKPPPTPEAAR